METTDINWDSLKNAEQVKHTLVEHLTERPSQQDIYAFANQHGLECSELVQSVIYCSISVSGKWNLIREKWLMEFHVSGGHVDEMKVTKGYIGF